MTPRATEPQLPLVAHVIDGLGSGGAESLLVTNLRHLDRTRHQHLVVTVFDPTSPAYPSGRFWEPAIDELGIKLICLNARSRSDLPRTTLRLARLLRSKRVRIMHSHLLEAGLVGRAAGRLARTRNISSLHNLSYEPEMLASYTDPTSKKHDVARHVESLSLRTMADALVAVGQTVADSAVRRMRVRPDRVRVIYNPVDFARLDAVDRGARPALLAELALPSDAELLVNVARLTPQKAQLDAVLAMPAILSARPNAHLVIIGDTSLASYVSEVRSAIAALALSRNVHLLGARRDVPAWLAASDVFLFPSTYEGLPVALAEATSAGCACVASDIAPNREVVDSSALGRLVKPGDIEALGQAVAALLGDRLTRRSVGEKAREASRRRFGPQESASRLMELYDETDR